MCPDGHRGCATAMLTIPAICASVSAGLRRPVILDVGSEDFGEWALGAAVVAIQTFVLGAE